MSGYTGIETRGDMLWLNPSLPDELKILDFTILYRQHQITIHIEQRVISITASQSNAVPISILLKDFTFDLGPGECRYFDL